MDDIECHSYDEISASPPMHLSNVDDKVKLVVEEMLRFKEDVYNIFFLFQNLSLILLLFIVIIYAIV